MSEPRLAAEDVSRVFPGGAGVHGVDLVVAPGQIHALVGLNGSGKTTLIRLLLGMIRPDSGSVRLEGRDLQHLDPTMWADVGHLVGNSLVYPELDTRTNLALAARLHGVAASRIGEVTERAMSELGLDRYAAVKARVLSAGNRQRVGLAAALQHQPSLIVLDEPTSALDPAGVILLRETLLKRAEAGAGVLVSSHHLDEVARIADQITVLNYGQVISGLDPRGVDLERAFFEMVRVDNEGRGI